MIKTDFHPPYNPDLIQRAKALQKNLTPAERKLWLECLRGLNVRVLRQRPIDNFIVDFYCPKLRLVIEVDGDSHAGDKAEACDKERTDVLEGYELKVVRFTNKEVFYEFEGVCQRVFELVGERSPLAPLKKGGMGR